MWLGGLNLLPPILLLLSIIISSFQVIAAFDIFLKKGGFMVKTRLFNKSVWNLRWL